MIRFVDLSHIYWPNDENGLPVCAFLDTETGRFLEPPIAPEPVKVVTGVSVKDLVQGPGRLFQDLPKTAKVKYIQLGQRHVCHSLDDVVELCSDRCLELVPENFFGEQR